MKRLLCMALALCLLLSGLSVALSEALDGEIVIAADAEDDPSVGEVEGDLFEVEAPIEYEADLDEALPPQDAAGASYVRLLWDAPVCESADGSAPLATLPEGSRLLVVETSSAAIRIACATEGGVLVGYIPSDSLETLTADEVAAMQAELFASRVVLYEDDLDRPLPWAEPLAGEEADPEAEETDTEVNEAEANTDEAELLSVDGSDESEPDAQPLDEGEADLPSDDVPAEADAELPEVRETSDPELPADTEGELIEPPLETCESVDSSLDSDALFASYVNRLFYSSNTSLRRLRTMASSSAASRLSERDRQVYDILKAEIAKVASGERSVTRFEIPVTDLLDQTRFTAEDLGVEIVLNEDGTLSDASSQAMITAFTDLTAINANLVYHALWLDCTYELYWLDRYGVGVKAKPYTYFAPHLEGGEYVITVKTDVPVTYYYAVMDEYQLNGDPYAVDTSLIHSAQAAAENAKAIVKKYANYSDYAKLYAYAAEICERVSYNSNAEDESDGNSPWKLIWVFDDDPDTNVVCEGFTQAFQYLCELSDFDGNIQCYMVAGYANGTLPKNLHSWNLVRIDGEGYVVDTTWMDDAWDGASGGMADWINDEIGKLFLCGGDGSVTDGYTVNYRGVSDSSFRIYRSYDTLALYPESALTLAGSKYVLTGWQNIGSGTYYFDADGHYLTGVQAIDGMGYEFSDSGRLLASGVTGWQSIGGQRVYFEADGTLHTQHTPEAIDAVPATCVTDGSADGQRCSICGTVLVQPQVIARGHSWGGVSYTWTADNSTVTARRVCANDATHMETETVRTTSRIALSPTCTAKGKTTYTATFSNAAFAAQSKTVENIPAKGHTPVTDAAVAATCTAAGKTAGSHCSVCGLVLTAQTIVPAKGHTVVVDKAVAATYTKTGKTEGSHCSVCGTVLTAQKTVAKLNCDFHMTKSATKKVNLGVPIQIIVDGKSVKSYASSNKKIATVTSKGWVATKKAGTAKITITLKNKKKLTLTVKVVDPYAPTSIKITNGSKASLSLKKNKTLTLKTKLAPTTAKTTLTWSSSNKKVATVSSKGVVTARKKGTTTITVKTANGKKATIKITVKK